MSFQRPKGTNDILPGESENGSLSKKQHVYYSEIISIMKCVHRFLNTMK